MAFLLCCLSLLFNVHGYHSPSSLRSIQSVFPTHQGKIVSESFSTLRRNFFQSVFPTSVGTFFSVFPPPLENLLKACALQ